MLSQGLSQAAPLRQSRTAIGIVPLRNGQGKKKHERKHKRILSFISVQKLQAETEREKYILPHV